MGTAGGEGSPGNGKPLRVMGPRLRTETNFLLSQPLQAVMVVYAWGTS